MNRKIQWKLLDNFKRKYFLKNEIKYKILKSLIKNNYNFLIYKYFFFFYKIKNNLNFLKIKQIRRCLISGRATSIYKLTKLSRFIFRIKSYNGDLPGFKRSSW